jgi:GNAT superfamily N-acetyltransferase
VIRRARVEDLAALVPLQQAVHQLHLAQRPDQFKPMSDDEAAAALRERFDAPNAKLWLAESAGEIVGYAVTTEQNRESNAWCPARRRSEIEQLGVARSHRRSGVARALLQAVVDDATASGITEVELTCWAFNRDAHAAFQSCGFTPKVIRFELER